MSIDFAAASTFALTLPDTMLASHYGKPAVKTNGHAFVFPGHEAGSFGLALDRDTIEMLKETDPDTFWQSPHYEGWPAVLVRDDSPDPDRVRAMIERSHAWCQSRKPPRRRK